MENHANFLLKPLNAINNQQEVFEHQKTINEINTNQNQPIETNVTRREQMKTKTT